MAQPSRVRLPFSGRAPTLAAAFDPRSNSIGFLRFALATSVLVSHSFVLGGFGADDPLATWGRGQLSLGSLAVDGFFVLSGFLITRSYLSSSSVVDYVWRRFLRIFPGYWVCLVITAFLLAPIAFAYEHSSLAGLDWFGGDESPLGYITQNAALTVYQWDILHLLTGTPLASKKDVPISFDGSLWTLRYEFECYMLVALAGVFGALRRMRIGVAVFAAVLALGVAADAVSPGSLDMLPHGVGLRGLFSDLDRVRFWFMFALGGLLFLYGKRIPLSASFGTVAAGVLVTSILFGGYAIVGRLAFAYVCLWLAAALPIRRFDSRGDFSYGVYIYAFPVQQMLALFKLNQLGWPAYTLLCLIGTLAIAIPSWFLIEARAQQLKSLSASLFARFRRAQGVASTSPSSTTSFKSPLTNTPT